MRNKALAARYYFWTELERRRFDDVMYFIEHNEFFVCEQSIKDVIREESDYIDELIKKKVSASKLRHQFPGFNWSKNSTIVTKL